MNNPDLLTSTQHSFSTQSQKTSPNLTIDDYIIQDHNEIKALMSKYIATQDRNEAMRWYNQFVWSLARHSHAEELILYPLWKKDLANGEFIVEDSISDHQKVKKLLIDIQKLDPISEEFSKKAEEMWKDLKKHLDEEELVYLPQMKTQIPEEKRIEFGKSFQNRKLIVPTRPHLSATEHLPTLEAAMGLILAPLDKLKDLFTPYPDEEKVKQVLDEFSTHKSKL
jgi:hemerythrin superfamily protein